MVQKIIPASKPLIEFCFNESADFFADCSSAFWQPLRRFGKAEPVMNGYRTSECVSRVENQSRRTTSGKAAQHRGL